MKKLIYLFSLIMILYSFEVKASHHTGFDMALVSLGNDLYKFKLVLYRKTSGQTLSNSYNFNIYKNSDNTSALPSAVVLNKISSTTITYSCKPSNSIFNIDKWVYESAAINLSSLNSVTGYYITGGECGREEGKKK